MTTIASRIARRSAVWPLAAILLLAVALRLVYLGFGFPALLDPDEPIFMLTALKLLRDHTLNPGWFGHPGTTTIYALAIVEIATFTAWHASGRFVSTAAFGKAVYTDPSLIFLPGRVFILVCGLATILLCFVLAKRLFGPRVALLAALLLTIDPIHIRYSQIIRTDMHSTVFVLLELLAAVAVIERGRRRDYLWAALWLGFATATKWPAAASAAGLLGAAAWRWRQFPAERSATARNLALFVFAAPIALFVASPYLFLDFSTVLENVRGEERPFHVGATGFGFAGNVAWYLSRPLQLAFGWIGLAVAALGCWWGARRSPAFAVVVLPTAGVFLAMISAQALIWERWVIPLLPLLSIAAAAGFQALFEGARVRVGPGRALLATAAVGVVACVPVLLTVRAEAAERGTDTRLLAGTWAKAHIPRGSIVTVEHGAFDILGEPWRFLYPMGSVGCVDVRAALGGKFSYSSVDRRRSGRPVVDLGTVDPARLATCRGDWAITVNWDRYRAEPAHFAAEIASYQRLTAGGQVIATFRPVPGRIGGPVVRVVRLARSR